MKPFSNPLSSSPSNFLGLSVQASLCPSRQGYKANFFLKGEIETIELSELKSSGRKNNLWKSTCFEIFFLKQNTKSYLEVNVSPSSEWNTYFFQEYRKGMTVSNEFRVESILWETTKAAVKLSFDLVGDFSKFQKASLSAIVTLRNGEENFFSLSHPSNKPDFHHPDSFVLDLNAHAQN